VSILVPVPGADDIVEPVFLANAVASLVDATSPAMLRLRRGERPRGMTNGSESSAVPGEPPGPIEPPRPKRGAFPTPKSEVEKARPYIPDIGDVDDGPEMKPDPPTDVEDEKDG
jgi:hypothetical protein